MRWNEMWWMKWWSLLGYKDSLNELWMEVECMYFNVVVLLMCIGVGMVFMFVLIVGEESRLVKCKGKIGVWDENG